MNFKLGNMKNDKAIYNRDCVNRFDDLESKVDYFYLWLEKNESDYDIKEIKAIVDKMVSWYELRYPAVYLDGEDIDKFLLGETSQKWCELWNFAKFYYSLSKGEKELLDKPVFSDMLYIRENSMGHLHFDEDGVVIDASDISLFDCFAKDGRYLYIASSLLEGKGIDEWHKLMKENKIMADYGRFNTIINLYKRLKLFKEEAKDTVQDEELYLRWSLIV